MTSHPTSPDYAALDALAGGRPLWHRYHLTCVCPSIVGAIVAAAQAAGATIRGLSLDAYQDDLHELRLRLGGIGSAEARSLSDHFHGLDGVRASQVEHQWT